jgi:hypothetical protein
VRLASCMTFAIAEERGQVGIYLSGYIHREEESKDEFEERNFAY